MALRLTHYGTDVLLTASFIACPLALFSGYYFPAAVPLIVAIWLGVLLFFRDPVRKPPADPKALVSPADGKVVAIEQMDSRLPFSGKVWRIDIFLSIANVHLNRAPFAGSVESVTYRKGQFLNALRPEASSRNESNEILLRTDSGTPLLVRQVAGVIARRIVCDCIPGDRLERGERFGMIKFGSRTELYLPVEALNKVSVRVGQRVKAGSTVIGEML